MPPQAAPSELTGHSAQQDADRQYYIRVLNEALELGLQRLRCLDQSPSETTQPLSDLDAANIYDRVTRSMRRSIMLADRLAHEPAALAKPAPAEHDAVGRTPEPPTPVERPDCEPRERLDRLECLPDLPTPELVRLIYRDLDLPAPPPPWQRPDPAPPPAIPPFIPAAAIIAKKPPTRRIPDH